MKKILFITATILLFFKAGAQNVGIGTAEPLNTLQVQGNLLVNAPTFTTNTAPTAAQTKTLVNGTTASFSFSDSTVRLYDPGGPLGNYIPGLTANANFAANTGCVGIELTLSSIQLGSGDSLIIKEASNIDVYLFAVGNGYNIAAKKIFSVNSLYVIFKSNGDASVGSGFSLLVKRIYDDDDETQSVAGTTGKTLFFDGKKGAFRSGKLEHSSIGYYSTALGYNTKASGLNALATGQNSTASGYSSTALGTSATAEGEFSVAIGSYAFAPGYQALATGSGTESNGSTATAMGKNTQAYGDYSTSMGYYTTASGDASTAMGRNTLAAGPSSTAMGHTTRSVGDAAVAIGFNVDAIGSGTVAIGSYVSTAAKTGSFIMGDRSTTTMLNSAGDNSFRARFDGGYRFYTSAAAITSESCLLAGGSNAWSTTSDVRLKENFATINGEDFLQKIAAMKLSSWNYKHQNPTTFRHYGPMAQDFFAAFGKDDYGSIGNDTTINSADFDGINLIAIQALEKRTRAMIVLQNENEQLKIRQQGLQMELDKLKARLEKMEAILSSPDSQR